MRPELNLREPLQRSRGVIAAESAGADLPEAPQLMLQRSRGVIAAERSIPLSPSITYENASTGPRRDRRGEAHGGDAQGARARGFNGAAA